MSVETKKPERKISLVPPVEATVATQPTPTTHTSSAASPLESESYELGQALRQIHASEQRLRKELKFANEKVSSLEAEIAALKKQTVLKTTAGQEEIESYKKLLAARESQIRALIEEKKTLINDKSEEQRHLEERKYLWSRIEGAKTKYDSILKQYNDLYRYCESILLDSQKKQKSLMQKIEEHIQASSEQSGRIIDLEKNLAKSLKDLTHSKLEKDALAQEKKISEQRLIDHYEQKIKQVSAELTSKLSEIETKAEKYRQDYEVARQQSNRARLERSEFEAQLKVCKKLILESQDHAFRARGVLLEAVKAMEQIRKTTLNCFEALAAKGAPAVTLKAGRAMLEQWQVEIETLKKIDVMLESISHPSKA